MKILLNILNFNNCIKIFQAIKLYIFRIINIIIIKIKIKSKIKAKNKIFIKKIYL